MTPKNKPLLTAIVSDTHIGGTTGLSLPTWKFEGSKDDDPGYTASKAQLWIYESWENYWQYVADLKKKYKARLLTIHLGDVVDGNHHQTIQAMPNITDQINMAAEIMTRVANMSDAGLFMLRGTDKHDGDNGQNAAQVSQRCGAKCLEHELIIQVGDIWLDCAHHGRAGKRDWSSSAAGMAAEAMLEASKDGRVLPRYVFRGHNHIIDDSGEKVASTRAIACPAWQLKTAFGHKVSAGTRSDIGGIVILPGGILDMSHARYFAAPGQRMVFHVE